MKITLRFEYPQRKTKVYIFIVITVMSKAFNHMECLVVLMLIFICLKRKNQGFTKLTRN